MVVVLPSVAATHQPSDFPRTRSGWLPATKCLRSAAASPPPPPPTPPPVSDARRHRRMAPAAAPPPRSCAQPWPARLVARAARLWRVRPVPAAGAGAAPPRPRTCSEIGCCRRPPTAPPRRSAPPPPPRPRVRASPRRRRLVQQAGLGRRWPSRPRRGSGWRGRSSATRASRRRCGPARGRRRRRELRIGSVELITFARAVLLCSPRRPASTAREGTAVRGKRPPSSLRRGSH